MNINDIAYRFNIFPGPQNEPIIVQEAIDENEFLVLRVLPNVDKFIKDNPSTKEIASPIFFIRPGQPDPDGLLSNEIFGITQEEREGIYGYIDLSDYFIHPLVYKKLFRMDRKFRDIAHGTKLFSIDEHGELIEDPEKGHTGLKWLKANFDKIKIKRTESAKRDNVLKFIEMNKSRMWMNKLLVLPAYYRDVNTKSEGKVAVGEINQLYSSLIIAVRGIKETADYGIDVSDSIKGRIQETILAIYDWFIGNNNDSLEGSTGLSKKMGYIRRSGQSKTTDYGSRLVLSASELKVEKTDDIMVDCEHVAVPLASICANFYPYMLYAIRRYFENEFAPGSEVPIAQDKGGGTARVKDPRIQFSDERIKEELKRFIHGYSNRFIPVMVELENGKTMAVKFKGKYTDLDRKPGEPEPGESKLVDRRLTWCDIFYMAACEVTKDKHVLITRYPIDSAYNQYPAKIVVSSTNETEPILVNNEFYRFYPKIEDKDIGTNTSSKFVDTLIMSNLMLEAIGGDFDGDTASAKGVYTKEANEELDKYIHSKAHYIGFGGRCIRSSGHEAIQAIYDLTRVLPDTKLDEVKF